MCLSTYIKFYLNEILWETDKQGMIRIIVKLAEMSYTVTDTSSLTTVRSPLIYIYSSLRHIGSDLRRCNFQCCRRKYCHGKYGLFTSKLTWIYVFLLSVKNWSFLLTWIYLIYFFLCSLRICGVTLYIGHSSYKVKSYLKIKAD